MPETKDLIWTVARMLNWRGSWRRLMCKCGHTPEQHEVSEGVFSYDGPAKIAATLYTSYCKEPECGCEMYRLVSAVPADTEGTRKGDKK